MRHVVMGTAGHVDHGKTTLVKRLTGVDTDRLEEEKRRGMTIELGFAPMRLPSGNVISIVDVPGHEKFIKSMVAGVTGIDFVTLVIAADEGVMPQTREHLEILTILEVTSGVVALTKCDLVDEEKLSAVSREIEALLKRTPLAGIKIIPVSALSGHGMDQLIDVLEKLAVQASDRNTQKLFRLPVDRVFTMTGHGTVVTGTIHGGVIIKGDLVDILPNQISAKVKGIQVHNKQVERAAAGDRCALNLSGIDKAQIQRGDVVAHKNKIKPQVLADVLLFTTEGRGGIEHNQRVHVHIGSKEVLARVRLLGTDQMDGNSSGYAQLRFEEPIAALRGDRFIIRAYSPMSTLGGGKIIYHETANRKRFSEETISALEIGAHGDLKQLIAHLLSQPGKLVSMEDIERELHEEDEALKPVLSELIESGEIIYLKEADKYLGKKSLAGNIGRIENAFEEFYLKNLFSYLLDREELRSKGFRDLNLKDFNALLSYLFQNGSLRAVENYLMQPGDQAILRISNKKETQKVNKLFLEEGFALRTPEQLALSLSMPLPLFQSIERFLILTHQITDLGSGLCLHHEHLHPAVSKIRALLEREGGATTGEVRDGLSIGRKATIVLLEYLDSIGITARQDNNRKPGIHFTE